MDTGKTRLLGHVFEERSKRKSGRSSKPNTSVSYINCRAINASSPSGMAQALFMMTMWQFLDDMGDNFVDAATLSTDLIKTALPFLSAFTDEQQTPIGELKVAGEDLRVALFNLQTSNLKLTSVIEAYTSMLRQCEVQRKEGMPSPPVIVIDEANVLMDWDASSKDDLEILIRFFVHLTTESKHCHVLLATSEPTFFEWLHQCEWLVLGWWP